MCCDRLSELKKKELVRKRVGRADLQKDELPRAQSELSTRDMLKLRRTELVPTRWSEVTYKKGEWRGWFPDVASTVKLVRAIGVELQCRILWMAYLVLPCRAVFIGLWVVVSL